MKNQRSWHWEMEQQTVYDLAEKHDSSLDLIEKNLGETDLVYELTEIDNWRFFTDDHPRAPAKFQRIGAVYDLSTVFPRFEAVG